MVPIVVVGAVLTDGLVVPIIVVAAGGIASDGSIVAIGVDAAGLSDGLEGSIFVFGIGGVFAAIVVFSAGGIARD